MEIKSEIKTFTKATINSFIRKQKVAMLHTGRCGSTVLGDLMNQNKNIYWSGEPFERLMKLDSSLSKDEIKKVIKVAENNRMSHSYVFATKYPKGMHLSKDCINMSISSYVSLLKTFGYKKFILIERSNHLKRAISMEKGRASGNWHSSNEINKVQRVIVNPLKFEVGINSFMDLAKYFKQLDDDLNELKSSLCESEYLYINYEEDISRDPLQAYQKVCDYIGLDYGNSKVKLKKTNPFPVNTLIKNYDEVKAYLESTDYKWMITE